MILIRIGRFLIICAPVGLDFSSQRVYVYWIKSLIHSNNQLSLYVEQLIVLNVKKICALNVSPDIIWTRNSFSQIHLYKHTQLFAYHATEDVRNVMVLRLAIVILVDICQLLINNVNCVRKSRDFILKMEYAPRLL